MSNATKTSLLTKLQKELKKHYKPVAPPTRTVLEHMLFACCLEDARHETGEEAFAMLQQLYFDWNEVRVTSVAELSESINVLPNPVAAGMRVRNSLHSVFEANFSFDMEPLRKQNLGKAVKILESYRKLTPFVINYVVQNGLGGHSIPLNEGSLEVLFIIGYISLKEFGNRQAPGLERAIGKSKGVEFASLIHQLGADYAASKHSSRIRGMLTNIAADAKLRLPKRGESGPPQMKELREIRSRNARATARKRREEDEAAKPQPHAGKALPGGKTPPAGKTPPDKGPAEKKTPPSKKAAAKSESPPAGKKSKPSKPSASKDSKPPATPKASSKKPTSKSLSKKKPR